MADSVSFNACNLLSTGAEIVKLNTASISNPEKAAIFNILTKTRIGRKDFFRIQMTVLEYKYCRIFSGSSPQAWVAMSSVLIHAYRQHENYIHAYMYTCSHTQMLVIIRSRDEKKNTSIMKKEFLTSNFSKIAIFCRFVVVILHESNSNLFL